MPADMEFGLPTWSSYHKDSSLTVPFCSTDLHRAHQQPGSCSPGPIPQGGVLRKQEVVGSKLKLLPQNNTMTNHSSSTQLSQLLPSKAEGPPQ